MEIALVVKLLAVGLATMVVGSPLDPTPDAPVSTIPADEQQSSSGGGGGGSGGTNSNAQPANKIAAAASSIEFMTAETLPGAPDKKTVTLFDSAIKVSGPTDLLIEVNAECALWTTVEVIDDDDTNTPEVDVSKSEAEARVKVWVTIDDVLVLVDDADTAEPGKVVFCDRVHGMTLTENEGDDDNETISNYLRTRSANSFSWIALNLRDYPGDGLNHVVKVFAELDAHVNEGEGMAKAAVGKRSLIVEPVMMANNAVINDGT